MNVKNFVLSLVVVISSTVCFAVTREWAGTTNNLWNEAANWIPTGVPTASDVIIISSTPDEPNLWPLIEDGMVAKADRLLLYAKEAGGLTSLLMTGGSFDFNHFYFGYTTGSYSAEWQITGGNVNIVGTTMIGYKPDANSLSWDISGDATVTTGSYLGCFYGADKNRCNIYVSENAKFNPASILIPRNSSYHEGFNIRISNNGEVNCGNLSILSGVGGSVDYLTGENGYIDIRDNGLLYITKDTFVNGVSNFDEYIAQGRIMAYGDLTDFTVGSNERATLNIEIPDEPYMDGTAAYWPTTVTAVLMDNEELAYSPSPMGRTVSCFTGSLFWSAGLSASGYDVYFGTNRTEVENADTTDTTGVYLGQTNDTSYALPEALAENKTYYWRVDSIGTRVWKGTVWSFVTASSTGVAIDDFEQYADTADLLVTWSAVGQATLDLSTAVALDSQALGVQYDNSVGAYSGACLSVPGQNWTVGNAVGIEVSFRGLGTNGADQIYAVVSDGVNSDVQIYGVSENSTADTTAIQAEQWNSWQIAFLNLNNIDAGHIQSLCIGVGDPVNSVSSGSQGTIFVDDITLFTCPNTVLGDLNNDCIVDFRDFSIMARNWLEVGL